VPLRGRTPSLRVPVAAYAEADAVLARALNPGCGPGRQPFAMLVPGASCPSRRYPATRFGAAAATIAAAGLPVLVAGTAAESGLVDEVVRAAGASSRVRALPPVGLPVFTALVARAAVALTNNSGGLHLADAVGTPVVVTYSGTERLGDVAPRAVPAELLQVAVPCSPCRQLACPFHLECLDVPPARLAGAALRLAAGATAPASAPPAAGSTASVPSATPSAGSQASVLSAPPPAGTAVPAPVPGEHPVPAPVPGEHPVPAFDIPASDIPEEDRWPHDPRPVRIA
jgi:Glycosyltransferase family 9 (heptosyltransferase)